MQCANALHIWGSDHDVFLGCLNSNKYDSKSIWNEYGTYGSKYNSKSIWNEYGTYGSSYSAYSPWNDYASYPPVIVDEEGNFYGYLTINTNTIVPILALQNISMNIMMSLEII